MLSCQKLYKESLGIRREKDGSFIEGPFYRCLVAESFLGVSTIVQFKVCNKCKDKGGNLIKTNLWGRIASTNENLKKWSGKLQAFAGNEEVKEAMLAGVKRGNRTAEEIIKVADELGIED